MAERGKKGWKSKRLHHRYQCKIPIHMISLPSKTSVAGELLDIGLGGGLVRAEGKLEVEVRLDFTYEQKEYMLDAYVVAHRDEMSKKTPGSEFYGIEFHPYPESLDRLNKFLEHLGETLGPSDP